MADRLAPSQRSANMRAVKAKDTRCELALRKALWKEGIRGYRLHCRFLPGKPDIVFTKHKLVVFVDGCFWHGCPRCRTIPETNREFWQKKIISNIERAKSVSAELQAEGWTVLRFWEHEIHNELTTCVERVRQSLCGSKPSRD